MKRLRGAIHGAILLVLLVAISGGALGFVTGAAPCHGVPYTAASAEFGAFAYTAIFGLPAAVVGAALGASSHPMVVAGRSGSS